LITTLEEAYKVLKKKAPRPGKRKGAAKRLLGRYAGVIPKGMTSDKFIREVLRETLYGKIKGPVR